MLRLPGDGHAAGQLADARLGIDEPHQLLDAVRLARGVGIQQEDPFAFRRREADVVAAGEPLVLRITNRRRAARRSVRAAASAEPSVEALSTRMTSRAGQVCAKSDASASCSIVPPFQLTTTALTSGRFMRSLPVSVSR